MVKGRKLTCSKATDSGKPWRKSSWIWVMKAKRYSASACEGGVVEFSFMAAGLTTVQGSAKFYLSWDRSAAILISGPARIKLLLPARLRSRSQAGVVAQERTLAAAGQKPQHVLCRTHAAPQLFPESLNGVQWGWQNLTKGLFEDVHSGQQTAPGPAQTAGLDQPRRGIEPTAHPRLGIKEALEPPDLQRAIGDPGAGQHRNGMAAGDAQKALHPKTLLAGGFAEAP